MQVPCGVALSTRKFTKEAFDPIGLYKDYVQLHDKFVLSGTRSGIAAAAALNVLKSLKLEQNLDMLKKFIDYDIDLAEYLVSKLEGIYDPKKIRRSYFNVVFPRKYVSESTIGKFILMKVGKTEL